MASEWTVDPAEFPAKGSVEDAIRFCLRYAVLAPSSHNAQPWWFSVDDNTVTIGLDVSRGLAVCDPDDREGTMGVAAALLNLRVALAHFGLSTHIEHWPDPLDPEACARVTALYEGPVEDELLPLFDQITIRRTSRHAFDGAAIEPALLEQLTAEASAEGVSAHTHTSESDRHRLAQLVADADQVQMSDVRFRRELASWLRRPGSRQRDGMHGFVAASPLSEVALSSPLVVRTLDLGEHRGAHDRELVEATPAMLVIATDRDERTHWMQAGQALERILLRATAGGLSVGFLDQVIEVDDTRKQLADLTPDGAVPQLLLRLGFGSAVAAPQPRRRLDRSLLD